MKAGIVNLLVGEPIVTVHALVRAVDIRFLTLVSYVVFTELSPVFVQDKLEAASVQAIVVFQFFRTVIALALAQDDVPLPTTNSLSVETNVVALHAHIVAHLHNTTSQND